MKKIKTRKIKKNMLKGLKEIILRIKKKMILKNVENAIYEKEVERNKEREQIEDNKNEKNEFDISMKDA